MKRENIPILVLVFLLISSGLSQKQQQKEEERLPRGLGSDASPPMR